MPRIISAMAAASADKPGLAVLSPLTPLAAELSGNILKVVFIMICVTRGATACSKATVVPSRVATRVGLAVFIPDHRNIGATERANAFFDHQHDDGGLFDLVDLHLRGVTVLSTKWEICGPARYEFSFFIADEY